MSFIELPDLTNLGLNTIREGSRILIVADYPSNDDVKTGRPFSDGHGAIISIALSQAGVTLAECSIAYVVSEAHTLATINSIWTPKLGFTTRGNACVEALKDVLVKVNPNVILTLGEISLQALTTKRSITKWRGSILESGIKLGQKVIPTFAPRDCAKMYLWRYFMASDCKKLAKEAFTPTINLPIRDLKIEPSFSEAISYMDNILKNHRQIACDIECSIGRADKGISCISLAISPIDCMSIPFDNRWSEEEELALWKKLAQVLEHPDIEKIYQNGADFDTVYLLAVHNIFPGGYLHDTMIKHSLNYPDFPKSLAFLTSIYTDEPYYKDDGKAVNVGADKRQFYIYNAKDSAVDFEINNKVSQELTKGGNQSTYDFCVKLMEPLMYMQLRGIKVNQEGLAKLSTDVGNQIVDKQSQLDTLVGDKLPKATKAQRKNYEYDRLNPSSSKQCAHYFYDILKLKAQTKTAKDPKTGEKKTTISTDNKAMGRLVRTYKNQEAALVKQIRGLRKLKGTYLDMNIDKDGRIRCSFKIAGTVTGRLSSSATIFDTGTNLQNLPLTFKEFLVADEGHILVDLDKAQAEWVASAYIFNDSNMIKAIEERADIHIRTAHMMFKAPEETIALEDKYLGSSTDPEFIREAREKMFHETYCNALTYNPLPNMSMRQSGKKCNHSFNYGLSPQGFSIQYDMPLEFSKKCYNLYHAGYPGIHKGHEHIRNIMGSSRTLTNLFGRKRRFLGRLDDNLYKAAYSFKPQSTVGELLNRGIVATYYDQYNPEIRSFMRPIDMLNQVHDNMLFQYPIRTEEEITNLARAIWRTKDNLNIPLTANGREFIIRTDGKVGFNGKAMKKIDLDGDFDSLLASLNKAINALREEQNSNNLNNVEEFLEELDQLEGESDMDNSLED